MIQFTYNTLTPVLFLTLSLRYNKLEDSKLIFSLLFALKYEIKLNGPITLDAILSPFIVTIYTSLSTAKWKLNVFVCFLFSVGSEVNGSKGTVIVNQNFYFSNDDGGKLLPLRVRQLGLFLNCEITGANFFKFYFFRNSWISVILNWRLSTAGESRVTGLRLASLSRGRHDTPRPSQTARHELTISQNYTKTRNQKHTLR